MKLPRIIAADIDGTLVLKGEKLKRHSRNALTKLHDQGVLFGVATGRPFDRRIQQFARIWKLPFEFDFIIGMNGDDLWINGEEEVRHFYPLKKEDVKEILEMLSDFDCNSIIYLDGYDEVRATRMDQFMQWSIERNHSHVVVIPPEEMARYDTGKLEVHYNLEEQDRLLKEIEKYSDRNWAATITFPGTIEFQDKRVNKGLALRKLAEIKGIDIEETMGFGDMDNDIELLKQSGYGVCLLNGSEATKAAADEITRHDVDHDGFGRYLEEKFGL